MSKRSKSGKIISVDFTGVETKSLIPDGDYAIKVKEVTTEEGDKGPYLNWVMDITTGEFKGKRLYYITSLSKQSLWNLRAVLEALGVEVPKKKMKLDLKAYSGMEMGVSVEQEKYRGKLKNVVVDIYNLEDVEGEEGEEGGEDDIEDMDLDELIEYAEKEDIDLTKKQQKSKAKALAAIQEAEEEEEPEGKEEEGEEEEEDGEEEGGEEEDDIEDMDLGELIAYAEKEDIDLTAKQKKSKSKTLKAIQKEEEE